jgi:cell wall assembly regulator SMI1
MRAYEKAKELLVSIDDVDFEGAKSNDLVTLAETALGIRFPPSYRRFLVEFGCGSVNAHEIYGVISTDFEHSGIPDAVWCTLRDRATVGMNKRFVVIGTDFDGSRICIDLGDCDENGEAGIVTLSMDGKTRQRIAPTFGHYFLDCVRDDES